MKIKWFAFVLVVLFSLSCASAPNSGLEMRNEEVSIEIKASKLDVFDAVSQVFISKGFSITATNERIGLIATDFKDTKKSFGSAVFAGLFGVDDVQVMMTTNIRSAEVGCILNILPKGRAKKSKNKDYEEITLSGGFMENIRSIGLEIKGIAEIGGEEITNAKPEKTTTIPPQKIKEEVSAKKEMSTSKVRVTAAKANIRLRPNMQGEILSAVPLGAVLEVQKKEGEWYLVNVPGQGGFTVTGYIHQSVVEEIREANEKAVLSHNVNLESPPARVENKVESTRTVETVNAAPRVANEPQRPRTIENVNTVSNAATEVPRRSSLQFGLSLAFPSSAMSNIFGLGLGAGGSYSLPISQNPMIDLVGSIEGMIFSRTAAFSEINWAWTRLIFSADGRMKFPLGKVNPYIRAGLGMYLDLLSLTYEDYWSFYNTSSSEFEIGGRIGAGISVGQFDIGACYHLVQRGMFAISVYYSL